MRTVPLRHAARAVVEPALELLPSVQLEHVESGTGKLAGPLIAGDAGAANQFLPGDVLFSKLRPYLAKSLLVTERLQGSGEFLCLRPQTDTDPRFLTYVTLSRPWLDHAVLTSYGTKMPRTSWEQMAELYIPMPALEEQRRIADFLDDRVARIDRIIAARHQQVSYLLGLQSTLLAEELETFHVPAPTSVEEGWAGLDLPPSWRASSLGRVLRQLTNGFVGPTRDILVDDGIRYVQGTHIKGGAIDFDKRPFFVAEEWHAARPRIHLRAGDVLIVQTGDVGQVALVPDGFGSASCHALLIARVVPEVILPEYLVESLRSHFGNAAMLARATGALHPHLEAGVRTTPLVLPSLRDQAVITRRIVCERSRLRASEHVLRCSIDLLTEYKQSLITAAVTGELDVTTAGSGIPG